MPIATLAMSDELQYPIQPGMEEEEENGGEGSSEFDKKSDGGNVEKSLDEEIMVEEGGRVEMTGCVRSDEEGPFAIFSPPPPPTKEVSTSYGLSG